jgi:hypothetical protein
MLAAVWICHKGVEYETNLAADYIDIIVGLNNAARCDAHMDKNRYNQTSRQVGRKYLNLRSVINALSLSCIYSFMAGQFRIHLCYRQPDKRPCQKARRPPNSE